MAAKARKRNVDQTKVFTTGSTVRLEVPRSSRQSKSKKVVAAIADPDLNPVSGFVGFLREHAVVGLAIGFVIGTQVQAVVKQLVASFINPLFSLLFGEALSKRTFMLHFHARAVAFQWGAFAYGLLDFVFVVAAIYIIVRMLKLDKLDKPPK